jgi:hypothetical protein
MLLNWMPETRRNPILAGPLAAHTPRTMTNPAPARGAAVCRMAADTQLEAA